MSEMIARIAMAIAKVNDVNDELHWRDYLPEARAAIKAMREPTEYMEVVAGNQGHVIDYYKKMIDAALK